MTTSPVSSRSSRLRLVGGGSLTAAGALALALSAPAAANAHVTAAASSTAAGSYTVVTFSLAHGCDGSPTTGLTITMPEGINSVSPTVNPSWEVVKNEVAIADPVTDSHGNTATQRVSDVVYTAKTPLADGYRDTVSLQLQLPETPRARPSSSRSCRPARRARPPGTSRPSRARTSPSCPRRPSS